MTAGSLISTDAVAGSLSEVPSLTTTQRDALTPEEGMLIYNSTTDVLQGYVNGAWDDFVTQTVMESYVSGEIGEVTGFQILTDDPGSPEEGSTWYNSTDKQYKGYDGTDIVILG